MTPYLLGTISLFAWMVLPGVAVGVVGEWRSPSPSAIRFLTVSLAAGISVWTLGAETLVRIGQIDERVVAMSALGLAIASLVVIVVCGRGLLRGVNARDLGGGIAIALGSTALATAPVIALMAARRDALLGSTPWYYWRLTRETVLAGKVPARSLEWGLRLPFLDDYPGFTASSAVLAVATGRPSELVAAQMVRVIAAVTTALACYALARTLGADRIPSATASVLLLSGATFATKFASFRPESAGYALMLLIPALAVGWLQSRTPTNLVVLAIAALALSEIHGIDFVFAMAWVLGLTLTALMFGIRRAETRRIAAWLLAAVGGTWLAGNVLLGGGLSGAEKLGNLPRSIAGLDPTWRFRSLAVGNLAVSAPPPLTSVARVSLRTGMAGLGWPWWALAAGLTVAGLVVMFTRRAELRSSALRIAVTMLATTVAIVVFSAFLAANYSTDVPRRTGYARLLPLVYVFFPVTVALVLSAISRSRRALGVGLSVVFALAVFVPAARWTASLDIQMPSRESLGSLRDLGLSSDALVLTNSYSEGFVPDVTGGRGLLDGRAPYTESGVLQKVNRRLQASIKWFAAPASHGVAEPLPVPGVTHVLVSTITPWDLGAGVAFPTDVAALDGRSDLYLLRVGPGFRLYSVVSPRSG